MKLITSPGMIGAVLVTCHVASDSLTIVQPEGKSIQTIDVTIIAGLNIVRVTVPEVGAVPTLVSVTVTVVGIPRVICGVSADTATARSMIPDTA